MLKQGAIGYFVIVNVIVYLLMAYDKQQAVRRKWRVPERRLLVLGMIGGGLAGLLARRQFHHKTQKNSFLISFLIGVSFMCGVLFIIFKIN